MRHFTLLTSSVVLPSSVVLSSSVVLLSALGCSASSEPDPFGDRPSVGVSPTNPSSVSPTGGVNPVLVSPGGTDGVITVPTTSGGGGPVGPVPDGCGDGVVGEMEACDDGNTNNGDGCASNCRQLEPGFSCSIPGVACLKVAVCGDGVVASSEQCDDSNRVDGDGCSARCKFELGFNCTPERGCFPTVCGDNIKEGAESCDDGNNQPFDGCSEVCITEPTCTAGAACTSACGDGLIINEACDDGNQIDGDGCSSTCTVEPGFMCEPLERPCEQVNGECVFKVPVIYRDHPDSHPDFGERRTECTVTLPEDEGGETVPDNVLTKGMVEATLGPTGRPVLKSGTQNCSTDADKPSYLGIEQFDNWFTDGPHVVTVSGNMTLFESESGGYVNRFTEEGDKFEGYEEDSEEYDGEGDLLCSWCFDGDCEDPCSAEEAEFDGNPLFFPVDSVTGPTADMGPAKIPAEYGFSGWPFEEDWANETNNDGYGGDHNFYFTTEVKTWFKYTPALDAQLDFTGDDDVWVFVNGKLAVDLGGIHAPADGSVTLNASSATSFGLADGQVYELTVFQAERRMEGSTFRLTLSGFENTPSECGALCGDGVVAFGEECDLGADMNLGGYGGCTAECLLGEFCGDGMVNGTEQCDPGLGNVDVECTNCQRKRIINN